MAQLPTPTEVLNEAYAALDRAAVQLSEARDWLKSDLRPGTGYTDRQAANKRELFNAISAAKEAINGARHGHREFDGEADDGWPQL